MKKLGEIRQNQDLDEHNIAQEYAINFKKIYFVSHLCRTLPLILKNIINQTNWPGTDVKNYYSKNCY